MRHEQRPGSREEWDNIVLRIVGRCWGVVVGFQSKVIQELCCGRPRWLKILRLVELCVVTAFYQTGVNIEIKNVLVS